ncbi:RNA polymerase [Bacteroidia bacterium]|nr:RNA polymerase [Bacteroidia bacterium]
MYNNVKDSELWNHFREGDKAAFAALFERTSDRLYRYGLKFTDDEELVKDCIQDLFLKTHQNRAELPDVDNCAFYLFKLLKNMLVDAFRQQEKIGYISPQELPFHAEFVYDQSEQDDTDDEIHERFEQVLSLLSDRQKEAIYLRYQAEMSYEEISQLLGINYQSARNLIHRSIEKIRKEMNLGVFITLFISFIK